MFLYNHDSQEFKDLNKSFKLYFGLIPYIILNFISCFKTEEEEKENLDTLTNFFKYFMIL